MDFNFDTGLILYHLFFFTCILFKPHISHYIFLFLNLVLIFVHLKFSVGSSISLRFQLFINISPQDLLSFTFLDPK
jgi:hypothetical protein